MSFKEENEDIAPYELSKAQLERLAILGEECGEVMQVIGKIIRHGYNSYSPYDENRVSNKALLENEIGDLYYAIQLLFEKGDVELGNLVRAQLEKGERIKKYLHYN